MPELEWTGERYVPSVKGEIRLEHVHRYLIARELSHGKRVLDIASGEGYGSDILASVATEVVGVDVSESAIAHATARYTKPNVRFAIGTCHQIPLPDASIDVVVCFETLEHVDRQDDALRELQRVLSPGGLLIISTPDRRQYSDASGNQNPYHVQELDREEFRALLARHFNHLALAGQRVRAGSMVGPLDEPAETTFVTFPSGLDEPSVSGLRQPVYFIALASDRPVPPLPIGLFEGEGYVWEHDFERFLSEVQRQCAEEIGRRLGETVDLAGSTPEQIGAEFTRLANRVSAHAAQLQQADGDARAAERQALEATALLATLYRELAESRATANAHLAGEALLERRVHTLGSEIESLKSENEALRARGRQAEAAEMALRDQVAALQAQVAVYEHSHSWQLTRPLRDFRRFAQRSATTKAANRVAAQPPPPEESSRAAAALLPPATSIGTDPEPAVPASSAAAKSLPSWAYEEPTQDYVPLNRSTPVESRIRLIAFYLPQFHPTPENDAWWGKGFTEWSNVTRAKPQFPGHYQPHLPGELGFYDLRLIDVQRRQAELARLYGIHGFCFHHYWFAGRRLLREPLDQLLAHPEVDLPFCLCWANENWTRRWDGLESEILIGQQHSFADDLAFVRDIAPALRDPRYIRIEGRLLLVVYRPALLPDPAATVARWRAYCRETGLGELYLVSTQSFDRRPPHEMGFDAAVEFPPNNSEISQVPTPPQNLNPGFRGAIFDYRELVRACSTREMPADYVLFRGVAPMWDNEARRPSGGSVYINSTPDLYREWLEQACRWTDQHRSPDEAVIFVNAWNEWAEGDHLEPDRRYGYAYLEATAQALERFPVGHGAPSIVCVSHDAYFHGAQVVALSLVRTLVRRLHVNVDVLLCGPGPLRSEFESLAPVHDLFTPGQTREEKLAIIRTLYDQGSRVAICNTVVVGDIVELLKQNGFTVISLIHELPELIRERSLEPSAARIAEHADRVVFAANLVKQKFIELTSLSPDKAVVRPQGLVVPNQFFGRRAEARRTLRAQLNLEADAKIVLAVGYADRRKGVDLFVDVAIQAAARHADVTFVWVGHREDQAFAAVQARLDASAFRDRVRFPGPIRDSDLFFAGADIYLMTSREDPFPNVVIQSLDAGVPVIGFRDAGGFAELLERGCGVLVPFGDTGAMTDAVLRLIGSPAEIERLSATATTILGSEFGFVNYTRGLLELAGPPRPKVSAIIPNYNYARYLRKRIDSVVNQTVPPHEVIFLDDCSTDNSLEIAAELLHASGISYRIIANQTNQGTYRQWLRGMREATGDLIWIAEADDYCDPRFMARLLDQFDQPDVVLAYAESRQIDADDRELAPNYLEYTADISTTKWRDSYVRPGIDEIRDTLIVKNTIPNVSAVLMRKADLSGIESKLLSLKNAGDWLIYVHMLENGKIAYVADVLNSHRRHRASVTIGGNNLNLMREILMVQRYVDERHGRAAQIEAIREASRQSTYEYLGLHVGGASSYHAHEALQGLDWPT